MEQMSETTVELRERACTLEEAEEGNSGGDTAWGDTRTHPEHESKGQAGRWYCTGDGVGEQEAARIKERERPEGFSK